MPLRKRMLTLQFEFEYYSSLHAHKLLLRFSVQFLCLFGVVKLGRIATAFFLPKGTKEGSEDVAQYVFSLPFQIYFLLEFLEQMVTRPDHLE